MYHWRKWWQIIRESRKMIRQGLFKEAKMGISCMVCQRILKDVSMRKMITERSAVQVTSLNLRRHHLWQSLSFTKTKALAAKYKRRSWPAKISSITCWQRISWQIIALWHPPPCRNSWYSKAIKTALESQKTMMMCMALTIRVWRVSIEWSVSASPGAPVALIPRTINHRAMTWIRVRYSPLEICLLWLRQKISKIKAKYINEGV